MLALFTFACQKRQAFLDTKPNSTLIVPTTLADCQALLDNDLVMGLTPVLGDVSADNYYVPFSFWQTLDIKAANAYVWAKDIYAGQVQVPDWDLPYSQVLYANVVLDGLNNMTGGEVNSDQYNMVKGEALFTRSYAFFNIAELFAPVYDSATASSDMGIPLRVTADINVKSVRSSVKVTYDTVINNLLQAVRLLPAAIPVTNLNRPSRPAAMALLARVYLSLRNYALAGIYADSALQAYSMLIDYASQVDTSLSRPFTKQNPEIIYQSNVVQYQSPEPLIGLLYTSTQIDSVLLGSYDPNDLRRHAFYKTSMAGTTYLKDGYSGFIFPFTGLATDELYLIRAECAARAGKTSDAMTFINSLLQHRWGAGTFPGYSFGSAAEALDTILLERRKELPFRGVRWSDLRRFNQEGTNIILTRNLNGSIYHLDPSSELYTLPIPPDVLSISDIPDNPRN